MIKIEICPDPATLGQRAARLGADAIRAAIAQRGAARIILATGVSQFATLDQLVAAPGIDWSRVTAFHLDEYIGMGASHPASFRRYLQERFVARVGPVAFIPINGDTDPAAEIARCSALISAGPIDVCFAGLGENCHLAFNDPPADFETDAPYIVVALDEACRRQQLGEGWFPALADVPTHAISMSIKQIMRSALVVLSVPETRKAQAVRDMLAGDVTPLHPASALQHHPNTHLLLDPASAALLDRPV